jgi:hypothetical protein
MVERLETVHQAELVLLRMEQLHIRVEMVDRDSFSTVVLHRNLGTLPQQFLERAPHMVQVVPSAQVVAVEPTQETVAVVETVFTVSPEFPVVLEL